MEELEEAARAHGFRLVPILVRAGPLAIDPVERRVTSGGRVIPLMPREYALLVYLIGANGRCVDRTELLAAVWGLRFDPGTNVVAVHVSRLRAKLGCSTAAPIVETVKRRGYRIIASA